MNAAQGPVVVRSELVPMTLKVNQEKGTEKLMPGDGLPPKIVLKALMLVQLGR